MRRRNCDFIADIELSRSWALEWLLLRFHGMAILYHHFLWVMPQRVWAWWHSAVPPF
jgi:hypothetical protein